MSASRQEPGEVTTAREREEAARARIVARRAIRRLDILEWVIFVVGALLALVVGAGVAWLVSGVTGWGFRATWIGASLALFVVPGTIAIIRIKREERRDALRAVRRGEAEHD